MRIRKRAVRAPQMVWWVLGAAIFIGGAVYLLMYMPSFLVGQSAEGDLTSLSAAERIKAVTDARQGVLFGIGGFIAVVSLLFTKSRHILDEKKQALEQDSNWTGRYTEAVKQLGDESSISVRLGGIYALERIAQDSVRDRQTTLDLLCAYLREKSPAATESTETEHPMTRDTAAAAAVVARITGLSKPRNIIDLHDTNLTGAVLIQANFSEANLSGARLSWSILEGAILDRTNVSGANLHGANLRSAELQKATLTKAKLHSADLTEANLTEATLLGTSLSHADLISANLVGAHLNGADLSDANLTQANLSAAEVSRAHLANANLSGAKVVKAHLRESSLANAYMQGANLHGTDLSNSMLFGAELQKATLTNTRLRGADLEGADLSDADLTAANLAGANLIDANFSRVNLTNADLSNSKLRGTNFDGADLSEARRQGPSDEEEPVRVTKDFLMGQGGQVTDDTFGFPT